jgi:hypothetical protein
MMLQAIRRQVNATSRLAALALSVAAILALFTSVAEATVPKLVPNGNFHSEHASGVAVDNSCSLHTPPLSGSACTEFDPSANDVFVTSLIGVSEEGNLSAGGHGEKFDASGKALSPPPPFAEGFRYGAAVNPTNGRLYVASPSGEIEIYEPDTGELRSSFPVPQFYTEGIIGLLVDDTQIAADAAGDVYVPNVLENEVRKYSDTGMLLETLTGSGVHALKRPSGVAVDSSGNVWVADDGNNRIEEFSATGAFLSAFESEGVRALALDGHGDLLAIVDNSADNCGTVNPPCEHLVEYTEGGAQLSDLGAGDFGSGEHGVHESMVSVDNASGRVYVTDGLKSVVWVYQPPLAPVLGQESAAEVGTSEAKLGALVQPGGIQATYRFEYLTEAAFQADKESFSGPEEPVRVPYPEGSVGEGFSSRTAWASAKGLAPGTTYHYRAVVTNGLGSVAGPDQTFTTETVAQATCPNEQARGGFSAGLPDCRAYELVTPPSKSSAQPDVVTQGQGGVLEVAVPPHGGYERNVAASDGNRFAYISSEVMPGSQSAGLEFIATRGPNGWSPEDTIPLRPYTGSRCNFDAQQTEVLKYSLDLSKAVLVDNQTTNELSATFSEGCRGEQVEVVSGEPLEQNLLARDNEDGVYQLVNLTPAGLSAEPANFVAASADLNVVVFSERAKLTSDAVNGAVNLYEWNEGALRLLTLKLPSGAPVAGSVVSVSTDGSDLLFTANGNLYVRVNGERTVQLDEKAPGATGPGGGGSFGAVSADGSQVFFTDNATAGLTSDTVAGSGKNLYRYDVSTGQLSDLTPVSDAKAALTAVSEDGSYVYFSSEGVQSGSQTNQLGETAKNGQPNLYVDHDGAIEFVMNATIMATPANAGQTEAISQNGAFLAFNSTNNLTGYDNNGAHEIYLYRAAANRFECASCNPSGEAPTARGADLGTLQHPVSDNGQVFFQADEALLPRDTNGKADVYEYDYNGGLHLISTGTSANVSILLDASVSGNDVFFLTAQELVPQDNQKELFVIYDARVAGGFPEGALPPACTTADACRSAPALQPSIYGAPASQTFSGVGNLAPPEAKPKAKPKAKHVQCKGDGSRRAEKQGKCVKKPAKKAKKSAHANRRGK